MKTFSSSPETQPTGFIGLATDVAAAAGDLAKQHGFQMRAEVRSELARGITGAEMLSAGGGLIGIGAVFLLIAFIQLLQDRYGLSASASWGSVGVVAALVGLLLSNIGHRRLHAFNPVPEKTLNSIRESFTWIANR